MKNFKEIVVPKPWGKEYLLFEENDVAGWILHINQGEKTSLHCHPNKKTSLIVLEGVAKVSFLSSSHIYEAGSKIIIREGVFHSTEALTNVVLLETETPVNKEDLVRLKDSYGRENKPYETTVLPRSKEDIFIDKFPTLVDFSKTVTFQYTYLETVEDSNVVIIDGGIVKDNIIIAGKGDCLTGKVYTMLLKEFELLPGTKGILIHGPMA